MKMSFYPLGALILAIMTISVGKVHSASNANSKLFWKLRPGLNHTNALTPTSYTQVAGFGDCYSVTTLCGIVADPSFANPTRPNIFADSALFFDLVQIQSGTDPQSNNSGEVFFKI